MSSFHQICIPGQGGNGLRGVTPDNVGDMWLEPSKARPNLRIHDIDAAFEILPEPLDGVQLRAVREQPRKDDVLRPWDASGHVCWSLVEEDDVETLGIVLPKLLEQATEAVGIQARQLPPEGLARRGFNRRIEPVRGIERLDDLEGLHAIPCEPTVEGQVQAQARFILAKEPYSLVGRLPS